MPCDHTGPAELIQMSESWLRERAVPEAEWNGRIFRFGENHDGFWASVLMEVERRGDEWIVTRLDRGKEPLPESELGLQPIA